ncbi:AraC family ligand binding domain-containing protein [Anaerobutyricum hallii]|uniref:AraC family ligand binding domain-containing protein n=1 Tax=Anaerobutyricum hallii TaxID=39488 RepID=UPI003A854A55
MDKLQYKIYHENKTHTPDDFPYNTYLCSIPLDFKSVNLHWHDEVEIIVIKKGTGIVSVDLTTYLSAPETLFLSSPDSSTQSARKTGRLWNTRIFYSNPAF